MSPAGMAPFLCPKEAGADHEVALIEEVGRVPDKAGGRRCTLESDSTLASSLRVQGMVSLRVQGMMSLSVQGMVSLRVQGMMSLRVQGMVSLSVQGMVFLRVQGMVSLSVQGMV